MLSPEQLAAALRDLVERRVVVVESGEDANQLRQAAEEAGLSVVADPDSDLVLRLVDDDQPTCEGYLQLQA